MKFIFTLLISLISISFINAQSSHTEKTKGINRIKIYSESSIQIIGNDGGDMIISEFETEDNDDGHSSFWNNKKKKEVDSKENDITKIGIEITRDGDMLIVKDLKSFQKRKNDLHFSIPSHINIVVKQENIGDLEIEHMKGEVELFCNVGDIDISHVTGPIIATSNVGDIQIQFDKINQEFPTSIQSNTGDINIILPSKTKADLNITTNIGEIFTDLDININRSNHPISNNKVMTSLNGGGVIISINSNIGDINIEGK